MNGTIDQGNQTYWWWAGPANDGAEEDYCVHCRGKTFGVTQYMDTEPSESDAQEIATHLIPKVNNLN